MLEFFFLILTPLVLVDTILLFVIANKVTEGRCWAVSKIVMKWCLVAVGAVIVLAVVLINWEQYQKPLTELGEAVLGLLAGWAVIEIVRRGIVRPF